MPLGAELEAQGPTRRRGGSRARRRGRRPGSAAVARSHTSWRQTTSASTAAQRLEDRGLAFLPRTEVPPEVPGEHAACGSRPAAAAPSSTVADTTAGVSATQSRRRVRTPGRRLPCAATWTQLDVNLLDGAFYAGDPYPDVPPAARRGTRRTATTSTGSGASAATPTSSTSRRTSARYTSSKGSRPLIVSDESMINHDDPLHQNKRRLVARRFTPRR